MADALPEEILKALEFDRFKNSFRVDTDHCLKYVRRQSVLTKNIILTAQFSQLCTCLVLCTTSSFGETGSMQFHPDF